VGIGRGVPSPWKWVYGLGSPREGAFGERAPPSPKFFWSLEMHILLHYPALLVNIIATLKDKFEVKK